MKPLFSMRSLRRKPLALASPRLSRGAAIHFFALLALAGCMPSQPAPDLAGKNPSIQLDAETLVKKVCLEGVVHYATHITDSVDSVAGRSYWIIGGAAHDPDTSNLARCNSGTHLGWAPLAKAEKK